MTTSAASGPIVGPATAWPIGLVLRDIARSGLAGLLVGIVVAGLGGRIVMRLAALRVPDAAGSLTDNGNVIGQITLGGTLALVLIGLFFGAFAGVVLVVVRPWLPGAGLSRAIVAALGAIALGAISVINARNPDFVVLRHDPLVVAMLIGLVGLVGLTIALVDDWLERRLPVPAGGRSRSALTYGAITAVGAVLILPIVVGSTLSSQFWPVGLAEAATGCATLAWWAARAGGAARPSRELTAAGRTFVIAAVVLGFAIVAPEVAGALGSRAG